MNIALWQARHVNYVFIFEIEPRTRLSHHQIMEMGGVTLGEAPAGRHSHRSNESG